MRYLTIGVLFLLTIGLTACGGEKQQAQQSAAQAEEETATSAPAETEMAGGPSVHVELGPIDEELAQQGEEIFNQICVACHRIDQRLVGPPLRGVTQRRDPEWIMKMILDPEWMIQNDPIAKQLFEEYKTPMTNQNLSEEQARALLEYLRAIDEGIMEPSM